MTFVRKFRFQIILRVSLLSLMISLFFFLLFRTTLLASTIICGLVILFQIFDLIQFSERSAKYFSRFLESIRYADFSGSFSPRSLGSAFQELNAAFSEVMQQFQQIRREKEQNFQYLQTVVEHIGVGLIAFQEAGEVLLINRAAKKLLNKFQLKNIVLLSDISPALVETLFHLRAGEKELVKYVENEELIQLMIYATEFQMREQHIKLVSLQNIQSELEEKELEAWQKLIRVLTHEIMNSITPIASLSNTVMEMLVECQKEADPVGNLADINSAIQTIQKRSDGLLHFVQAYRSLTRLPKPDFQIFKLRELFNSLEQLMMNSFQKKGINFRTEILPESLELTADPKLVEQILINLLNNALEALENFPNPRIELLASLDARGRAVIQVKDNGLGISEEAQDKIFIPFYTTKKGGSGIGLSLAKQIMRLHKGNISFTSRSDTGTVFRLTF
jgi:two-component system nitrogen regulation sensor histidine kinase NtrY